MATIAPQLTARAIILSVVLAMMLAAANTYLGLFAGMTIASAIPAAVVSMAVLRVLGGGGILENNIVQTGASAGSSIASGVIFTVPALVHHRVLDRVRVLVGARHCRARRLARRVVLGAAAPRADRRPEISLSRRARRRPKCSRPARIPAQGVRILGMSALAGGLGETRWRPAACGCIPDTARGRQLHRQIARATSAPTSRRRCSASATSSDSTSACSCCSGSMLSWNIAIPIYSAVFPRRRIPSWPPTVARVPGLPTRLREPARSGRRADPLPRRRRDARRRRLGADHVCASRCCRASRAAWRRRAPAAASSGAHRARPADEVRS